MKNKKSLSPWISGVSISSLSLLMSVSALAATSLVSPAHRITPEQKMAERKAWFARHVSPDDLLQQKSEMGPEDRAENLVDRLELKTLTDIDQKNLSSAQLAESPWSDTYWPLYQGELAQRYADSNFPSEGKYSDLQKYIRNSTCSVDELSPAEKYDLLVGDSHKTMTEAMLREGARRLDGSGNIETWMGICHGWAPASFMVARPTNKIEVLAADGQTKIPFYPSDIKALNSALWAQTQYPTRFIGGRCNEKDPARDAHGRVIDPDCLDTNPATWHLSVVNQIGISKRSFVIDANWNYEVWNQPVYKYEYQYFNPKTQATATTAAAAQVSVADYSEDPLKSYRSAGTAKIVGVQMSLSYISETSPTHNLNDSQSADNVATVDYRYTLEMDSSGKLLGGEWEGDDHPDFLWTPAPGAQAASPLDAGLDASADHWDGSVAMPVAWRTAAQTSSRSAIPLNHIVSTLVTLSHLVQ